VVQVADPDAVDPPDLVAIAGADPAPGGPEMVGGGDRLLGQPLLGEVVRQDDVRPVADVEPVADLDPLPGQRLDLLQEGGGVDHDAVADHAVDPGPEDARRHRRELVRHAAATTVCPALAPP
jgi:hypothetical protein